jgi:hypothetical protein
MLYKPGMIGIFRKDESAWDITVVPAAIIVQTTADAICRPTIQGTSVEHTSTDANRIKTVIDTNELEY